MSNGMFTLKEILSQPAVWKSVLEDFDRARAVRREQFAQIARGPILVTGCGSTHSLSLTLAATLRQAGLDAWGFPASEIVFFPELLPKNPAALITVSRSGSTSETIWAVEKFRQQNPAGVVCAITTLPDSPLAQKADLLLAAPQAQEISLAQTRSFTSMLLLGQLLAAELAGSPERRAGLATLPAALEAALPEWNQLAAQIGGDLSIQRFFFLGSGPFYGLACEAMMKNKEMTLTWSEAFHTMEFRHGPMSQVDASALVVGLISERAAEQEWRVMQDMKALGGRTLVITNRPDALDWSGMDTVVTVPSSLSDWDRGIITLPFIQLMAYYRAIAKDLNPDQPENLSMFVQL